MLFRSGLVVDDAIVVLENTHRQIMLGLTPMNAAMASIHEIAPVVVAMTIIVSIVFIPIAMTSGITGVLFREFAITVFIAVLFSGFFSLILSPMMCGHMLTSTHTQLSQSVEHALTYVTHCYHT